MIDRTFFQSLSTAAEGWLNPAYLIATCAKQYAKTKESNYSVAAFRLLQKLAASYQQFSPAVYEEYWKLPERLDYSWPNAHKAAEGIVRRILNRLYWPVRLKIVDAKQQQAEVAKRLTRHWKAVALSSSRVQLLQERIRRERAKLLERLSAAKAQTKKGKHLGRPRKEEKGKDLKIVSALLVYHNYGGTSFNNIPIGVRALAKLADVTPSSVTKFFQEVFSKALEDKGGRKNKAHDYYKLQCLRGGIKDLLAKWDKALPRHGASLRDSDGAKCDPEPDLD